MQQLLPAGKSLDTITEIDSEHLDTFKVNDLEHGGGGTNACVVRVMSESHMETLGIKAGLDKEAPIPFLQIELTVRQWEDRS